ncbi:MAG TPA: hypothetical protein VI758_03815 [Bacteroidota bacterium]
MTSTTSTIALKEDADQFQHAEFKTLYRIAGIGALLALTANVFDLFLGFGNTQIVIYGSGSALDWFTMFRQNWFKGLYTLGIFNIVYQCCLIPVCLGLLAVHRLKYPVVSVLAAMMFFVGMAVYVSNNAAIPMMVLSGKHAAATTDAQRAIIVAAGEAILAAGEDFTPGSFVGLILGGLAMLGMSFVILRGDVFSKTTGWTGIVGFSFLSIFIVWATFIPVMYNVAYFVFGTIGGMLALAWFTLVGSQFLGLARKGRSPE